jgi:hypothetical protein
VKAQVSEVKGVMMENIEKVGDLLPTWNTVSHFSSYIFLWYMIEWGTSFVVESLVLEC